MPNSESIKQNLLIQCKIRKYIKVKRVIDSILAFGMLFILWPFILIVAILIKFEEPKGNIIFKQMRVGKDKVTFWIYKFRTMKTSTPNLPTHQLIHPEQYITKVGKILRKTSLDELPQLINILKGEMSFIGPRPALWSQEDLIREREIYNANCVRPGLSGLAQINGRDQLSIRDKAQFDGEYVRNMDFTLDVKIFIKTFSSVLHSEGVLEGGEKGNENTNNR